jgi:hypothetical protein
MGRDRTYSVRKSLVEILHRPGAHRERLKLAARPVADLGGLAVQLRIAALQLARLLGKQPPGAPPELLRDTVEILRGQAAESANRIGERSEWACRCCVGERVLKAAAQQLGERQRRAPLLQLRRPGNHPAELLQIQAPVLVDVRLLEELLELVQRHLNIELLEGEGEAGCRNSGCGLVGELMESSKYALPINEIEEPFCSTSGSCLDVWIAENSEVENLHSADKALR